MSPALGDNDALALGHDYQADAIERDPSLTPHFSNEGRKDIARALRMLAIVERAKPGTSPWDAVLDELEHARSQIALLQEQHARGLDFDRGVGTTPISHEELMDTNEHTSINTLAAPINIAPGEHYAGLSRNHETEAWHHVVLLPATPDKDLTWQGAIDWAKSVGGELPTRFESALIFANLRDKVDLDNWHWTATPCAGDERYAWVQHFGNGTQGNDHKDGDYRAVAVRRVSV